MAQLPQISIVFPNLNGASLTIDCLKSIRKLNYPKSKIETIVVDNHSTDGSQQKIKQTYPRVKLIENKTNLGFAKAVNQAVEDSRSKLIFVTNNDVFLEKNCLNILVDYLITHKNVGVVGPSVYSQNSRKILHSSLKFNLYTGLFRKNVKKSKEVESDWIEGSGMLFKRTLWEKLGGFDEGFFFIFEDLDFCRRAAKIGYKIVALKDAIIQHKVGATVNRKEMQNLKFYEGYKSKMRFTIKHASIVQIATSLFLQFAIYAPYRFLIIREPSLNPLIRATFWTLTHLGEITKARTKNKQSFSTNKQSFSANKPVHG